MEFERLFHYQTSKVHFLKVKLIVAASKEMISIKSKIEK